MHRDPFQLNWTVHHRDGLSFHDESLSYRLQYLFSEVQSGRKQLSRYPETLSYRPPYTLRRHV
jgi:hypothetical protein